VKRAILLVDHGSRREDANAQLEALAGLVRERVPDRVVRAAHMEIAAPDIAAGIQACVAEGAEEIVVVPCFLWPGAHVREDVPRLVREAAARHPGARVRVAEPFGPHPRIVDLVLERAREVED
jgi:sirohydrochlorin ferrochelatase